MTYYKVYRKSEIPEFICVFTELSLAQDFIGHRRDEYCIIPVTMAHFECIGGN